MSWRHFSILLALLIVGAGTWARAQTATPPEIEAVDPEAMPPSVSQAMHALGMWRAGKLGSLPFVSAAPNLPPGPPNGLDLSTFSPTFQWLDDFREDEDGTVTLGMLMGMVDRLGRVDVSMNRLRYRTEPADGTTVAAIAEWLLQNRALATARADAAAGTDAKGVVELQKEAGVRVSGTFDAATAKALARAFSMVHLIAVESHIFYPDPPGHAVLIVPYDRLLDKPELFSAGSKSLPRVLKLAVPEDELRNRGLAEGQYAVFVYFLDRVEPEKSIQLRLTKPGASRSLLLSKKFYADTDPWPVVVQDISVGKRAAAPDLAFVILVDGKQIAEYPIRKAK
jgi:hypothetical protein